MTDIPLRAIAELERRRQQQLQIADSANHSTQRTHAEGKADGYATAVDVLKAMRSNSEGKYVFEGWDPDAIQEFKKQYKQQGMKDD